MWSKTLKKHTQRIAYLILILVLLSVTYLAISYFYSKFYASKYAFISGKPFEKALCKPVPSLPASHKVVRILVLPGGAINGIFPLHILDYLTKKTGVPVYKLFDLITATSTGSLIATGLTYPNKNGHPTYTPTDMLSIYNSLGSYTLSAPWWYRIITANGVLGPKYLESRLRNTLAKVFSDHIEFSQLLTPTMISAYDLNSGKPYFFRSWGCRKKQAFYIHDILSAATATPGFFPPVKLQDINGQASAILIDGGLIVNNPVVKALQMAMTLYPHKQYLLVVLGTGKINEETLLKNIRKLSLLTWLPHYISILLGTQEQQADSTIKFIKSLLPKNSIEMINVNVMLKKHETKIYATQNNLQQIHLLSKKYIQSHQHLLNQLAVNLQKDHL